MTSELLERVRQAGLILELTHDGRLACTGEDRTIQRWLQELSAARQGIIAELQREKAADSLSDDEIAILWAWLIADGDTPEGAAEVIDCCRRDRKAREFFIREARK
jgi:hypothetical protein